MPQVERKARRAQINFEKTWRLMQQQAALERKPITVAVRSALLQLEREKRK